MLLAYRENPSFFAVGQRLGVNHQTVQRCVERAVAYVAPAALDDRPRPASTMSISIRSSTLGPTSSLRQPDTIRTTKTLT
jgi:hypothetical protein